MTEENRSPLDNALDLLVYAPVGLALTAVEELPKLAEKGRAQIQGQITIARMVGQFAVAQGRKQIERRLGANGGPTGGTQPRPTSPAAPVPRSEPAASKAQPQPRQSEVIDADGGYTKLSGRPDDATPPGVGGASAPAPQAGAPTAVPPRSATPSPNADQLAIPGYDSLSASQVVQRLAGLSRDELEAVGAYESGHRARRTILTRVNQLKG